jgi:hypothetical protein
MKIWQVDFYKSLRKNQEGQIIWELVICDPKGNLIYTAECPQFQANSDWLVEQLQQINQEKLPNLIQVFRPQSLSLLTVAAGKLNIKIEATRRTNALKQILQNRANQHKITGESYNPIKLEKPVPQPLPENIWGENWRFASLPAGQIIDFCQDRPIPILEIPEYLLPINLNIASPIPIPGVIIYGGRQSMKLAKWLEEAKPVSLNYVVTELGEAGGLVLESGLIDRWVINTFEDIEVAKAAQIYQARKQESKGLHFLLIQPDDSGMTYTGFWLLGEE